MAHGHGGARRAGLVAMGLVAASGVASRCGDDGPIAPGVTGRLGDPMPAATPDQLATFERGRAVAEHRFSRAEGLGPAFNVTFCASCHEKPVVGGSAGLYRNFNLAAMVDASGGYFPSLSAGDAKGVLRIYHYGEGEYSRPAIPDTTNWFAQRNAIPFFGVGLLAELPESEILSRADPDDRDGDGISGRPNYDRGFVGRFGMKAQTVSIEGFIRGPLKNHAGITTDPLTDEQRARLPVDSSGGSATAQALRRLMDVAQAAAPDAPLTDEDAAPDPELSGEDLFDLVSFAMLTAAPAPEPLTPVSERGHRLFHQLGCDDCHAPRLRGPRGPIPAYSDLLLHDLGADLADGVRMGEATGSEFRTQPLWGVAATAPYLHDGRAGTLDAAIRWHGGEAEDAAHGYAALDDADQDAVVEFLLSLGGRDQASAGLLPPDAPVPAVGAFGGPVAALSGEEEAAFLRGRGRFDRDFSIDEGVGAPRFNGDSCRACHFEPVLGGSGPRGVNVMRHGLLSTDGAFVPPTVGTILHRVNAHPEDPIRAQAGAVVFEHRQTPPLFGLGLVEGIDEADIVALADPDDRAEPFGISGKASYTDGGRFARFGWKAQVPDLDEFARDAFSAELGLTLPYAEGRTFGRLFDDDDVPDPEIDAATLADVAGFVRTLGPPPPGPVVDPVAVSRGEQAFADLGCADCHVPTLPGADGPVALYSDLLLHDVLPDGEPGVEDAAAEVGEYRTAPLWGVGSSGPWLHDGRADTLTDAILGHAGEAEAARERFSVLTPAEQAELTAFLESL
jgi:CxxC motif-containing protein (DUF1111 family)